MPFVSKLTPALRTCAAFLWSFGLASVAFDRVYLFSAGEQNAKVAYLFFGLAAAACCWAEKREFGTRVFLYRLHDIAVSGPWQYLLLYFLWVNLFAPFTVNPIQSVVYALAGWFGLASVGFTAQLIFCDRGTRGIALVPSRLRLAFLSYNFSVLALSLSYLLARLAPDLGVLPLFENRVDALIYFTAGFPFLVWDFANPKRQLMPRALVALTAMSMMAALFLMRELVFLAAALSAPAALLAIGIYKRIRLQRSLAVFAALCLLGINGVFIYSQIPATSTARELIDARLGESAMQVERKLRSYVPELHETVATLKSTHFLGAGVGSSNIPRGVWLQILAETGVVGLALYLAFFASLIHRLVTIRHAQQLVVSNVALISATIFLVFLSHFPRNPYGTGIWIWYALWAAFGSTRWKRDFPIAQVPGWHAGRALQLWRAAQDAREGPPRPAGAGEVKRRRRA